MLSNVKEIGERIKKVREERQMKQLVLASQANVDVASLSRYENGKQTPSLESLVNISQKLNISLDYLVYGENKKTIFSENDEEDYSWAEIICYALATLIETNIFSIDDNQSCGEFIVNLPYNFPLLEFVDKMFNLSAIEDSISEEEYEKAKAKIVKSYAIKMNNLENFIALTSSITAKALEDENEEKCRFLMKKIIQNHKKTKAY